jgi:ribosomal protein S18 acetylase RimI-like enzyme
MSDIVHRLATERGDYERLQRYLAIDHRFGEDEHYVSPGDLDWWLNYEDDPAARMREIPLWLEGDSVVAWCYAYKGSIDIFLHPSRYALLPEIIAWAEKSSRASGAEVVELYANDRDTERQRFYASAGYTRTDEHFIFRTHSLAGGLPHPRLPDGYRFRDMTALADGDLERRVELHRVVWEPSHWTAPKHARLMQTRNYRPDLDLIVVAPNGDFAAYMILWFEPNQAYGLVEPVGCHPVYRQQKLTQALMYEGLRRLKRLGADRAYVSSSHASLPANRLYESCGFTEVDRIRKWTRSLS